MPATGVGKVGRYQGETYHSKVACFEAHGSFCRLQGCRHGLGFAPQQPSVRNSILLATPGGDLVRAPGDYVLTFENGAGEILSKDLTIHGEQVVVEPFPGKVSSEIFV